MQSICVAGHICLDLTPNLGGAPPGAPGDLVEVGPMAVRPGGAVANTGLALTDLGAAVTVHAAIGSDPLGDLLVAGLRDRGLDPAGITAVAGATTSYSLVIERSGSDRTFWHHTGANARFDGTDLDPTTEILHLGYPPLLPALLATGGVGLAGLLARARAAGVTTSVDLAVVDPASTSGARDWTAVLDAMCPHTDVLSPSLTDLTSALDIHEGFSTELVDRLASRLIRAGAAVVAISDGRRGLFIRTAAAERFRASGHALARVAHWADRRLDVPSIAVDGVVTTNGAGDAASAGLLFAMAAGAGLEEAGMLAVASAAAVVTGQRPEPETVLALQPALRDLMAARR